MALIQNGTVVGDGSWLLRVHITDLKTERSHRVTGAMHIGGLMLNIVQELDVTRDWSDHALWWPIRRKWLTHTRSTLDQMGVTAENVLEFTPMHKVARVQLPDLQTLDARLDFSVPVFNAVLQLCRDLGVRYPEELSLKRYINPEQLKKGLGFESDNIRSSVVPSSRQQEEIILRNTLNRSTQLKGGPLSQSAHNISQPVPISAGFSTLQHSGRAHTPLSPTRGSVPPQGPPASARESGRAVTPGLGPPTKPPGHDLGDGYSTIRAGPPEKVLQSISFGEGLTSEAFDYALVHSPGTPLRIAQSSMLRPRSFIDKASLNRGWLDSSRSLMEQGIFEGDLVQLRFKFTNFFDLNPKYDPVRINQLFEQAKWSVLMEELDATDEEATMFAALQLQALAGPERTKEDEAVDGASSGRDEVDELLSELETQLAGVSSVDAGPDIMAVPELNEYLRYFKPKKLTLKGWKRAFFSFRDLYLSWYPTAQEAHGPPLGRFCLKGCEVTPDVNIGQNKYAIKLLIPSAEGMSEFWLKCDGEIQYARFLAGCRLASRGKTMADASYQPEVESIKRLLSMQHPGAGQFRAQGGQSPEGTGRAATELTSSVLNSNPPEELLPQRTLRRGRTRQQLMQRIVEAHGAVSRLSSVEAKLQYVRAWQALPEHGIHYFVVRFRYALEPAAVRAGLAARAALARGARKDELLSVAYNRMMRLNVENGETLKTWRFASMKRWHVNWEIKHLLVQTEEENVEFKCISADCKVWEERGWEALWSGVLEVPHEFIGGYIFLSLRSKDQNQTLDEELFHKLTGGWGP